jgi:hypothetical protein
MEIKEPSGIQEKSRRVLSELQLRVYVEESFGNLGQQR